MYEEYTIEIKKLKKNNFSKKGLFILSQRKEIVYCRMIFPSLIFYYWYFAVFIYCVLFLF